MKWNHKLENLLNDKSFTELSAEEQSWVLQFCSKKQYAEYRHIVKSGSLILSKNPILSPSVKTQVMAALPKTTPFFQRSSVKKLAIAASWLLFIAIGFLLGRQDVEVSPSIVYQHHIDTVYLEQQTPLTEPSIAEYEEIEVQYQSKNRELINIDKHLASNIDKNTSNNLLIKQNDMENIALQEIIPVTELPEPLKIKSSINSNEQLFDLILEVY